MTFLSERENEPTVSWFCHKPSGLTKGQELVGSLNLAEYY
jgi:hypothetical protein